MAKQRAAAWLFLVSLWWPCNSAPAASGAAVRGTCTEDSGARGSAGAAAGVACRAEGGSGAVCSGPAKAGVLRQDVLLLQKEIRSSVDVSSARDACLCVFDIDRTLTTKQGVRHGDCPGSESVRSVWDSAYDGGWLKLSALAVAGIESTFCGSCYLGVVSAGDAGGHGSRERKVLVDRVLTNDLQRALARKNRMAQAWSYAGRVRSPFVLRQPDRTKEHAVRQIVQWYRHEGVQIRSRRVHFFGDRTENIGPFQDAGFNAREISCGSRDWSIHNGIVGLCGATPEEVVSDAGVHTCSGQAAPKRGDPRKLDSGPGHNGGGGDLQACQGDCDSDSDCAGSLRCFQRDGHEDVPGCAGKGIWSFDYCFEPTGSSGGERTGGGGSAGRDLDSSPGHGGGTGNLQLCQGDCDGDADCAEGLRCFQRDRDEDVPGCSGKGVWSFDYCYAPGGGDRDYQPGEGEGEGDAGCCSWVEGQCGEDAWCNEKESQCEICAGAWIKKAATHGEEQSGGAEARGGGAAEGGEARPDASAKGGGGGPKVAARGSGDQSSAEEVEAGSVATAAESAPGRARELDSSPGQHGQRAFGGKLQACQGDCDTDGDCAAGLRCFYRNGFDAVPGCTGKGVWNFDYCHEPPVEKAEPHPHFQAPAIQARAGPRELDSSPGQFGAGEPLSLCQGDCDHDGDCGRGLRCFHRAGFEPIPGCSGRGVWDFDYCYDPSSLGR